VHDLLASHLDDLAARAAALLDAGQERAAWALTADLELAAGVAPPVGRRPPGPVIGRRFAAAHRRVLRVARRDPAVLAAVLGVAAAPGVPVGCAR
jgi:hypothetical protein